MGFEIFRPIFPMLASTAESAADALAGFERASVEWKLDGIRIQIHRRGDEVRVYTRNLNEITDTLPGIVRAVRALPVETGRAGRRGALDDARRPRRVSGHGLADRQRGAAARGSSRSSSTPSTWTATTCSTRRSRSALRGSTRSPRSCGSRALSPRIRDAAERVLEEALAAGHEGIVVKDASSRYSAGRRGKAWRKVKPVRTYDLVVLGAEWGHGRRQGRLSNLHLGARDPRTGEFVMVGKTFKGMTDELLEWQTRSSSPASGAAGDRGDGPP